MPKRTIARILTLVCTLLIAGAASAPSFAQSNNPWSTPIQVSETVRTSWFPDVAATPDGTVYFVWTTGVVVDAAQGVGADLLMYRELRNGKWSQQFDVANPYTGKSSYAIRNSIVANRDGRIHLLVRGPTDIDYTSTSFNQTLSIQYWDEPRRINGSGLPYYTALNADPNGNIHALWNEITVRDDIENCPCYDIFYRKKEAGSTAWTIPQNLSESKGTAIKPQVATDNENRVHVVWSEDPPPIDLAPGGIKRGNEAAESDGPKPGAVYYRRSIDGGENWEDVVRFDLPQINTRPTPTPVTDSSPITTQAKELRTAQITLGLYRNTNPIVVYRSNADDQAIYFQTSRDGGATWGKPQAIQSVRARPYDDTPFDAYSMVTDGAGNVHLFMVGILGSEARPRELAGESLRGIQPRLLHLTWNGSGWSQPTVVVTDERYPEWPRAVVVGSTIHLTWFTRNAEDRYSSENSQYKVWYSRRQLSAPAVVLPPLFTPTPNIPPTATPAPPTPIPTPTLTAQERNAPQLQNVRPSWELEGYQVLALSALPVLLALGGFAGFVIWSRRRTG
ncbi:MAG: exo-alpha-sialidase [Roseiflexaceae bacterium]